MGWNRLTITLFVLTLTLLVVAGFMLLMLLGSAAGTPEHAFARYGLAATVAGFIATAVGAWISNGSGRRAPRT